ncbi:ribokinase [Brenneria goodwinii]|uniref:Ribokinase n=1 Tax=Brenneria goodwinii TaxID=1109412 RepID=A0AAE8EP02_9GAMM|nr:PfkB family carbohydrate kinase [Brenneria goodwinii]ATA25967.1 ribokinase [Brenneria goodwinii]MCG8157322.1 ribokinase [Brenneria goodwinii]MCG8163355.1 ribokinase [Brenneria goodwinii]MCG8165136.1 ribokinase [Brenneria goodwinii]MCG8170896.1 ribokinase [Brenneria goodwinii]
MKVLGIGDNVVDRYTHTHIRYPGGNALNFSVYAEMLGAQAAYLGVFGDDDNGSHVQRALAARNIDTSHCRVAAGENGYADLTIKQGERIFLGSNAGGIRQRISMDFAVTDIAWLSQFALLHTGAYSYLDKQLPALSVLPGRLSYDFSDDFDVEAALALCPLLDYAFFSCAERSLEETRRILLDAHRQGSRYAIATRGAQGAVLFDGQHWLEQPPQQVAARDTLGAGDAFITAFLLAHLAGRSLSDSLKNAAAFAAQICLLDGAFGEGERY